MTSAPNDNAPRRAAPAWLIATPIAHRGLHELPHAPENSRAAFDAAVVAGFPIELDVRLLASGEVAVFHDHDLERMTGARGTLEDQSAAELQGLRLLGTAEGVPLLGDVLARVDGRVPLLIEIKADPRAASVVGPLENAVLGALRGYGGAVALQSFRAATLAYLAEHAPRIPRGQLASSDDWYNAASGLPNFVGYHLGVLPTPLSSELRALEDVPLLAWTIQTPENQRRAAQVADNYIFEVIRPDGLKPIPPLLG